jgi:ACS family hexuronate transporter-like MFS transporter
VPLYVEIADRAGRSWEFPFWSIGLIGLAWIPIWFFFVGDRDLSQSKTEEKAATSPVHQRDLARCLITLGIIVATLTISWQFLRAWLALFLQDHHGYSKQATRGLMSGYFIAADVGCLLSGVLVKRWSAQGWHVNSARQMGYFLFTLLSGCAALAPFVGNGWLMVAMLFVAGAGILGLHPYYYSLTQDLPTKRMGFLSGALAASGWIVSSLSQIFLGRHIESTKSYQLGLVVVGVAPMIGLIALLVLWPKRRSLQESARQ